MGGWSWRFRGGHAVRGIAWIGGPKVKVAEVVLHTTVCGALTPVQVGQAEAIPLSVGLYMDVHVRRAVTIAFRIGSVDVLKY